VRSVLVVAAGAAGAAGAGAAAAGAGAAGAAAAGAAAAGGAAAAAGAWPVALRGRFAKSASSALTSSSLALPQIAIGNPGGISSPSATRCLINTPASKISASMLALSVPTSAMIAPDANAWPSAVRHATSVPNSMVGDTAGIS
jgi:hypothetical protein